MADLHLYDFGIFIDLQPDEEEKAMLENNIQQALQQQGINLEDAIDIREIKNVKLANQLLKLKRKRKAEEDAMLQQQNIQQQAQANAQAQQVAAQAEAQKNQVITQNQMQLEQTKAKLETEKMMKEAQLKKELMNHEFQLNMQIEQMKANTAKQSETNKEDRKDERTKIQASQQSELIDQRKSNKPPKNFESSGNDIMGGGFGMNAFEPR